MRLCNQQIMDLLRQSAPRRYSAGTIVRRTGLSFSAVRDNLNRLRSGGLVERDLDIGLNGHTLYMWYWIGETTSENG